MKVLVAGIVESKDKWQVLLDRVNQLHTSKHGPFDVLIVLPGSVPNPLAFPLQVVTSSSGKVQNELDVQFVSEQSPTPIHTCDVLMSQFLPGTSSGVPNPIQTDPLAETWALATKPRYHFCGGSHNFFQRAPYRNVNSKQITRLVVLCPVGSTEKWIHALNIPPAATATTTQPVEPAGTTDCPYVQQQKPVAATQQFFFSPPAVADAKRLRLANQQQQQQKPARQHPVRTDCWFCLASATCEKHLIVHVEQECYLALPKGGIQLEHVLLVPISHQSSFASFLKQSDANKKEVVLLINRIQRMFARQGFGVLITDRSLFYGKAAQQHAYLELLPVPLQQLESSLEVFQTQCKQHNVQFEGMQSQDLASQLDQLALQPDTKEYLYVCLPSGKAFVHYKNESEDLDDAAIRASKLQFGRALCIALGSLSTEIVHWKACVLPKPEEAARAKQFAAKWKETE